MNHKWHNHFPPPKLLYNTHSLIKMIDFINLFADPRPTSTQPQQPISAPREPTPKYAPDDYTYASRLETTRRSNANGRQCSHGNRKRCVQGRRHSDQPLESSGSGRVIARIPHVAHAISRDTSFDGTSGFT